MSPRALRIGVDARPLSHPFSGIGRYTEQILRVLALRGDCDLYLYGGAGLLASGSSNVFHRRMPEGHPLLQNLFVQTLIPRWARLDQVDVFWSPRHHLPLGLKVPSVVTIHDMAWKRVPQTMRRGQLLVERTLMPRSIARSSEVIAISQATLEDLKEFLELPHATVIYPAATVARSDSAARNEILFVGTREPRKNLGRLLEAFQLMVRSGIDSHHLVLAGSKGWGFDLKHELDKRDLNEHVILVDGPTNEQLSTCYARSDFLVLPSLYEGFGLPLVEAMAFGKPVITSSTSAMPEVAGNAGLLIDPYSVQDMANAMTRLVKDRDLYERLALTSRRRAQNFTWETAATATLTVLERVAARGSQS